MNPSNNNKKDSITNHLIEIKKRLIYFIGFFLSLFLLSYFFIDIIFSFIANPIIDALEFKDDKRFIYTNLTEVFITYIKLSLISAFIFSFPFFIYQIWAFISPGLLKKEKKLIFPFLFLIPIMFLLGFIFVYYLIIPLAWDFFVAFDTSSSGESFSIQIEPKINEYISITLKLALAFGFAFQLPTLIFLLTLFGITTTTNLKKNRRFVIVIIFLVSAIITPPDIISQIGLAIPILLLYEFSIFISNFFEKKKK